MEEDDSMAAWHWREGRTARIFVLGAAQRHVLELEFPLVLEKLPNAANFMKLVAGFVVFRLDSTSLCHVVMQPTEGRNAGRQPPANRLSRRQAVGRGPVGYPLGSRPRAGRAAVQHGIIADSGLLSKHEQMRTAVQHGIHVAVCADSSLLSRQDSYSTCCRQLTPASCPDQVMCRRVESFLLGGHSLSLKGTVKIGGTPGLAEVSDEHQEACI
ncbi:hypothetical protein Bbelb_245130 [Branchiostoma belcheri]|nr:hypothetical protein Bbelb_245130 [Branchiostoma belcheri]